MYFKMCLNGILTKVSFFKSIRETNNFQNIVLHNMCTIDPYTVPLDPKSQIYIYVFKIYRITWITNRSEYLKSLNVFNDILSEMTMEMRSNLKSYQ